MTKTDQLTALIEADLLATSAWTNPVLFAREAIAGGHVEGPLDSVQRLVTAVTARLRPMRVVVAGDFHVPFHNVRLVDNFIRFVADAQPDALVFNGDFLDCFSVSSFPKPPGGPSLQAEFDVGRSILERARSATPKAKMFLTEGNHEERLQRFLVNNPGLHGLRDLSIPAQLRLENLDVKWYPYMDHCDFGKLTVVHGCKVSKHSAYTAKAHLLDYQYDNVIHGHTHRLGAYYMTGAKGKTRRGFEAGGLFDADQADYLTGEANWQNGFAVAEIFGAHVHVELIEATREGMFLADGKVYR